MGWNRAWSAAVIMSEESEDCLHNYTAGEAGEMGRVTLNQHNYTAICLLPLCHISSPAAAVFDTARLASAASSTVWLEWCPWILYFLVLFLFAFLRCYKILSETRSSLDLVFYQLWFWFAFSPNVKISSNNSVRKLKSTQWQIPGFCSEKIQFQHFCQARRDWCDC